MAEPKILAALFIFPNTFHIPQGMLWLWKRDYICALTTQVLKIYGMLDTLQHTWKKGIGKKYLAS